MVGVPKSGGCSTCRKRKKKCGEELPACSRCVSAGWKCPGYPQRWTFISEDHRLASYYKKKRYVYEDIESSSSEAEIANVGAQSESMESRLMKSEPWSLPMCTTISSGSDTLGSHLVYYMVSSRSQTLLPLQTYGTFFQFVPSRLGLNRALDSAVSCLCGAFSDSMREVQDPSRHVLRQYSNGLRSLRACLDEPNLRFQSETLCASIVLQLCELMINRNNDNWQLLTRGTSNIIQNRGPERHVSAFDHSMLESQQTSIISHSANSRDPCFLVQPEWQHLLKDLTPPETIPDINPISLRIRLCEILAHLSQLSSKVKALRHYPQARQADQKNEALRLLKQVMLIHENIQIWHSTELEPNALAFSRPLSGEEDFHVASSLEEPAISHKSILFVILDCVTNSALLSVEKLILRLSKALEVVAVVDGTVPTGHSLTNARDITTSMTERQQRIRSSFQFVKRESPLSAKPLEFGLMRIGVVGNVILKGT